MRLQEERKGFEQLDEDERDTVLAQIYPSLRQVIPRAALCPVLCSSSAQQACRVHMTLPQAVRQCFAALRGVKAAATAAGTQVSVHVQVPAYADFIKERFERCLDLYLCPRTRRKRLFVPDAKALVPKLPKPRDLQPFPTMLALRYLGHEAAVSLLSITCRSQNVWWCAHSQHAWQKGLGNWAHRVHQQ